MGKQRNWQDAAESISSLSEQEGFTVEGELGEIRTIQSKNYPDGLQFFSLTDDDGNKKSFWLDGGLRGAFSMGKVEPGAYIRITYKGKKPFTTMDGKEVEVNDYKVQISK